LFPAFTARHWELISGGSCVHSKTFFSGVCNKEKGIKRREEIENKDSDVKKSGFGWIQ
jgi:hypothetical protein